VLLTNKHVIAFDEVSVTPMKSDTFFTVGDVLSPTDTRAFDVNVVHGVVVDAGNGDGFMAKASGDWAVVRLDASVNVQPMGICHQLSRKQIVSANASYAGFGATPTKNGRDFSNLVGYKNCKVIGPDTHWSFYLDCPAEPGDSGSPVVVQQEGGACVIGVLAAISDEQVRSTKSVFVAFTKTLDEFGIATSGDRILKDIEKIDCPPVSQGQPSLISIDRKQP